MTDLNVTTSSQSDRILLDRFISDRDEAAFAILVQRYHGLVMGVCRRVLGNANDAEDDYQISLSSGLHHTYTNNAPSRKLVTPISIGKLSTELEVILLLSQRATALSF